MVAFAAGSVLRAAPALAAPARSGAAPRRAAGLRVVAETRWGLVPKKGGLKNQLDLTGEIGKKDFYTLGSGEKDADAVRPGPGPGRGVAGPGAMGGGRGVSAGCAQCRPWTCWAAACTSCSSPRAAARRTPASPQACLSRCGPAPSGTIPAEILVVSVCGSRPIVGVSSGLGPSRPCGAHQSTLHLDLVRVDGEGLRAGHLLQHALQISSRTMDWRTMY